MLWTILVILLILWLLGLLTGYTMGGVIHILLVIAVIVLVVRLIRGRKILKQFSPLLEKVRNLERRWSIGPERFLRSLR